MNIKLLFICILVFCTFSSATFIKGKAKVYTIDHHVPFAVLYESTYVTQTWDAQRGSLWIEMYGCARKSNFSKEQLEVRKYSIKDTIYLYADSNFQKIIGYAWPATDSLSLYFQDVYPSRNSNYLECNIYGHVDSSSILEFEPWKKVIKTLNKKNQLFNLSFSKLESLMFAINNDCTPITGVGDEYSQTYDEERPTPNHTLISYFHNGKLKALWSEVNLNIKNKEKVKYGYLYFDDSVKSQVSSIKKEIKGYLNYTP
jgi:hypothetical protein